MLEFSKAYMYDSSLFYSNKVRLIIKKVVFTNKTYIIPFRVLIRHVSQLIPCPSSSRAYWFITCYN